MSRSKLSRALLVAASLVGAIPLLAQTPVTSSAASFPLGQYQLVTDPPPAAGQGQTIAFSSTSATMSSNGQVTKVRGFAADGQTASIFDLQGACTSPAVYRWRLDGDLMTLALQSDPCGDPSHAGRTLTLRKLAAAAPAFPFGTYALVALDSIHGPPPGMSVSFSASALTVMRGEQVVETHGLSITGDILETFTLGEGCTDPGEYHWKLDGNSLTLIVIKDPCTERAMSIASVRFDKQ